MATRKAKQTLHQLVESLFTNGAKSKATRLVLVKEEHNGSARITGALDLGGWSREAIKDRIQDFLAQEQK